MKLNDNISSYSIIGITPHELKTIYHAIVHAKSLDRWILYDLKTAIEDELKEQLIK